MYIGIYSIVDTFINRTAIILFNSLTNSFSFYFQFKLKFSAFRVIIFTYFRKDYNINLLPICKNNPKCNISVKKKISLHLTVKNRHKTLLSKE